MNRTQLTIYDFGKKIMKDIGNFSFKIDNSKSCTYNKPSNDDTCKKCDLYFLWEWNDYSGYGKIDFYSDTNKVCNEFGNNMSYIVVGSTSKRQAKKHISELYNEPELEALFNYILSNIGNN